MRPTTMPLRAADVALLRENEAQACGPYLCPNPQAGHPILQVNFA